MLKKQNSKFALKTPEAMEEHGQAPDDQFYRTDNKHGRMWSTGNGKLHIYVEALVFN